MGDFLFELLASLAECRWFFPIVLALLCVFALWMWT